MVHIFSIVANLMLCFERFYLKTEKGGMREVMHYYQLTGLISALDRLIHYFTAISLRKLDFDTKLGLAFGAVIFVG